MQKLLTMQQLFNASPKKVEAEDSEFLEQYVYMYNKPELRNDVDVYLDGYIRELSFYRNMLHYMRNMEQYDSLRIWVSSPGGYYDSAVSIISAMQNSQGNVQVIVTGEAASAGSLIALGAPNLSLTEDAYFMCHAGSYGTGRQKQGDIKSLVEFSEKQMSKTMRSAYEGFMSPEEIEMMLLGKDYYFDYEESMKRLEQRQNYFDAKNAPTKAKPVRKKKEPNIVTN